MTEAVHTNGNGHVHYAPMSPAAPAQIPGPIVKAIVSVQGAIAGVTKDGKNQHGGYAYASADAIYAMVTHKMADAGLIIICLEEHAPEIVKVEKDGKTTQWGRFTFSFVLATEQATWSDCGSRRSLFTPITGPQTFMAAQSYAEKTYLKSLFKIPTGDKFELDGLPQDEDPSQPRQKRDTSAEWKRGGVKRFNLLRGRIARCDGPIDCVKIWTDAINDPDFPLAQMPSSWFQETICPDFVSKMDDFGLTVELDDRGWPIIPKNLGEAAA